MFFIIPRLRQIINTTVEVDIPKYARMTIAATLKLKKFMLKSTSLTRPGTWNWTAMNSPNIWNIWRRPNWSQSFG